MIALMEFDHVVLDFAIGQVEKLVAKRAAVLASPSMTGVNTLDALRNVRVHNSLRSQYETIYNQCLVLLVSHFGSTLHELFRVAAFDRIMAFEDAADGREELKITLGDLRRVVQEPQSRLGELLIARKDFSFQDMQSTSRAFSDYLKCQVPKDEAVNNIIYAQACRHAIVHCGGRVDERLVGQVANAKPRTVGVGVKVGQALHFEPEEVKAVGEAMECYIARLCGQLAGEESLSGQAG